MTKLHGRLPQILAHLRTVDPELILTTLATLLSSESDVWNGLSDAPEGDANLVFYADKLGINLKQIPEDEA